jgi:DNA-binding CsgD family transcriptional regulator
MEKPDIPACARIYEDRFAFDAETSAAFIEMMSSLLPVLMVRGVVIDDQDRQTPSERIVAFGLSSFITDGFLRECLAGKEPFITARLVRWWREGCALPLLDLPKISRSNSLGGLNLHVLARGMALERLAGAEFHIVTEKLIESFFYLHGGYQIKSFTQEVFGDAGRSRLAQGGASVLADYSVFYSGRPRPGPDQQPYLMGCLRADWDGRVGNNQSRLFAYSAPHYSFSFGQKEVLQHALYGASDEEIANMLGVSLSTVHKRWRAIFERVAHVDPTLFGNDVPTRESKRGAEKRRHILNYVQQHLEEIRPHEH